MGMDGCLIQGVLLLLSQIKIWIWIHIIVKSWIRIQISYLALGALGVDGCLVTLVPGVLLPLYQRAQVYVRDGPDIRYPENIKPVRLVHAYFIKGDWHYF